MPADIFIYALIAAGLIFWLRSILGTRHGEERDRSNSNPYSADSAKDTPSNVHTLKPIIADAKEAGLVMAAATPMDAISDLAKNPTGALEIDNDNARDGLLNIAAADKNFDVKFFLTAAQDAFAMIVEAYARGDRALLEMLVSKTVYTAFDGGIAAREGRGDTQATEILSVRKANILDANLVRKKAQVTVRFEAEEISTTHNKDGELIGGHPDKATKMVDIWVFERSLTSKDPSWLLVETRSDDPEDNDLIPDTDGAATKKPAVKAKAKPKKKATTKKPAAKKAPAKKTTKKKDA